MSAAIRVSGVQGCKRVDITPTQRLHFVMQEGVADRQP